MMKRPTNGFTLIELMIALSLFAILVLLALPSYSSFMANTHIRNAAENSLNGVRLAQTTAIKGNNLAKFELNGTAGWTVSRWDDEAAAFAPVQTYQFAEGAAQSISAPTPAAATKVTFDGLGRVVPDASSITQIDVTNPSVANTRNLRLVISAVGGVSTQIKLCDPNVTDTSDPRICP
jgi:type IV fimbrial biogenesis protein FimT